MAPPTVQVRQLRRESSCRAQMLPERTGTANVRGVRRLGEGVLMVSVGYDRIRYLKPVHFGDTLTIDCEIAGVERERKRTVAKIEVKKQRDELVPVATQITQLVT
jgi:acyl dehydratase